MGFDLDSALAQHVLEGLNATPKRLSSVWLYDDAGSRLFQRIMALPEYYLTRVETAILSEQMAQLAACIAPTETPVDVIELGSGDGTKTVALLSHLARQHPATCYHPIDISAHAIEALSRRFAQQAPNVQVQPGIGDYFSHWPEVLPTKRQVVMFLGSNLGNFDAPVAQQFLQRVRSFLRPGDGLLLGLDLQKDPTIILNAYSDPQHVTAAFNVNLLARLNRELETNFDQGQFYHYATYSPLDGAARSFLVSRISQRVVSAPLGLDVVFAAGECIYMEQSQKYTLAMLDDLAQATGFARDQTFFDEHRWYMLASLTAQ